MVLCDYSGDPGEFPTVAAQYAEGMQQLVDLVVGLGRTRLVLLSTPGDFTTVQVREQRFSAAAVAHGVRHSIDWVDQTHASGEQAFRQLWASDDRPDAILTITDRIAVGCLAGARELGVSVPEDVAITGFDDSEFSRYVLPALTTVTVPFAQIARAALNQLIHILEKRPLEVQIQRFPVTFVRRQSA
ncbi:MAG: LacI family transcriptional regulator [Pleurocapsa sp. SU_196_0]|nr:LacI family transcriptional regulator [Pleurocapsa sp. SU_196_0]